MVLHMKTDIIDIVKSIRTLKSQIPIIRGLNLQKEETVLVEDALKDLQKEIEEEKNR